MKRSSFNVLFFLKKTKLLKNGEASVCMRITVDGMRVENNIRKSIDPSLWSQAKESARGKSRKSCDLNAYIENARIKLHQIFCELEEENQPITARLLQEIFFGQDKEPEAVCTLIGTMQEHNDLMKAASAILPNLSDRNTERRICRWRKSTVSWYVPLSFI